MRTVFDAFDLYDQYVIRPVSLWLPANPKFKLILELDKVGLQLEKSLGADKANKLKAAEFQVLHFSEKEIISDPRAKASELYDYLVIHQRVPKDSL